MISIGLIGCGAVVHGNYAQTLIGRDAYNVRYVCDTNASQAASAARLFDAEALALDALVEKADAVIISTPPVTHSTLVRACLRPGVTILCEKPYMTSYNDAVEACKLAHDCGARLYVGQFRRLFPQLDLAHKLVESGVLGELRAFSASEGGRFTWKAVSSYTTLDPTGGVLWDTGAHTLDMALYAGGFASDDIGTVSDIRLERDKEEPSHDFRAEFVVSTKDTDVAGRIHVSRREALPNVISLLGSRGQLAFIAGLDDRVRLTTDKGSIVLRAERSYEQLMECVDLQVRRILLNQEAEMFEADNFVGQIKLIEALANA
jgi:predicted dehydrogenase